MYESVTKERLRNFGLIVEDYLNLIYDKQELIRAIGAIKGIDYTKDRIRSGNKSKATIQERYIMRLERINNDLKEHKEWLSKEATFLRVQFTRLKNPNHQRVLLYRYILRWKFSRIKHKFFRREKDYEEQKEYRYRDKVFVWHRTALTQLEKLYLKDIKNMPEIIKH